MRALIAVALVAACGDDGEMAQPDAAGSGSGVDGGGTTTGDAGEEMPGVPPGCLPERSTTDRPDDSGLDQIRILYVVPSDLPDMQRDTNGQICNSVRGGAMWFHTQSGSYFRYDTMGGLVDIGFVRLTKTDAQMRGDDPQQGSVERGTAYVLNRIEREIIAMGLMRDNKLYAYYYEGSSSYACGGGSYPPAAPGRGGAMYLNGLPIGQSVPCGQSFPWGQPSLVPSYIDYGMLHELVHSMGIVAMVAPHHHSFGHVFDSLAQQPNRDLMYSPRMGQADPGWATNNPAGLVLDIGNDDYFNSPIGVDLRDMSFLEPTPANARRPPGW